uniref:Uncharacterized protein n=1 Tax=Anguilla anguilla TaxID=7936 RepID=A0A0E9QAT7_ANGAN
MNSVPSSCKQFVHGGLVRECRNTRKLDGNLFPNTGEPFFGFSSRIPRLNLSNLLKNFLLTGSTVVLGRFLPCG